MNNQSQSTMVNLESLNLKYEKLLKEYNTVSSEYSKFIQNGQNEKKFVNLKGRAFWGSSALGTEEVKENININQCQALCAANDKCTGATYNSNTNNKSMCWLRTGDGPLLSSSSINDYAIVPQHIIYLEKLNKINAELIVLNKQILDLETKTIKPLYKKEKVQRTINDNKLRLNQNKLNQDQLQIKQSLQEYKEIERQEDESKLHVNKNFTMYVIMFIILLLILFIFFKYSFSSATTTSASVASSSDLNIFNNPSQSSSSIMMGGSDSDDSRIFINIIIIFITLAIGFHFINKLF